MAAARVIGEPATGGTHGLTKREVEVLTALADRPTNAELAERMHLSERTVESHVSSLLRKLPATTRTELSELAKGMVSSVVALPTALERLADPGTFVGRALEQGRLRDLWARAVAGRTLIGLVAGEAGIGKSRLAAELAAEVHASGARVLLGGCFEDAPQAYGPLIRAIAEEAAGLDDAELRHRVGPLPAWARAVPEVAARIDLPAAAEVFDAGSSQLEILEGFNGYLRRTAESAPTLVVLEDVHWATPATLSALRHMARGSGHAPLLLLITTRDVPPDFDDDISLFVADLARIPTTERIDLDGLPAEEVAMLLDGGRETDAAYVAAETGGNPLLVREIANGRRAYSGSSLEALLARRYALLDSETLLVLEVASVLGSEFEVDLLASAAGRTPAEVYAALDHAGGAGLVTPTATPGGFAFVHGMFRSARYAAIPVGRRVRVHADVVRALEARPPSRGSVVELARHACIAAPVADPRQAAGHAVAAARLAESSLALTEAAALLRDAVRCADLVEPPDAPLRLELRTRLGELLQGAGSPDYHAVLAEAADLARAEGGPEALAEVGWALVRYGGPRVPGSPDQVLLAGITDDVLARLGRVPTATCARTLAAASEDLCLTEPEQGAALAQEALGIARQLDDPITLGHVLLSYRVAARTPDNEGARQPTADELIAIGERTGEDVFLMLGWVARAWNLREAGALAESEVALAAGSSLRPVELLPPTYRTAVVLFRASLHALRGDLQGAEEIAESVLGFGTGGGAEALNWYAPAILLIRHSQGRLTELLPMIEGTARQPGVGPVYRAALAVALAQAGDLAGAGSILAELTGDHLAGVPRNFTWLASAVALAEAAELTGDVAAAAELRHQLEPHAGRIADLPQTAVGSVDLALAQVALATGDVEAAEAFASRAVEASRARGTDVFLGRELIRLAVARRRRGATVEDVRPLVDEALALADRTGAALIRQEAERLDLLA